ncbi:GNAT family N-acetyltransferase [Kitasatospora sp. NPDC006697]|uniref:GNAT family N-acetyltransferase n=1 Tax=Kitasatospora sp. NPDC006697 TaxID=3364020 RepID=UPI0036A143E7
MPASFPETAISTERLLLRPLEEGDAPELVAMMADDLVLSWTDVPQPYTAAHALDWIRRQAPAARAQGRGIAFAVTENLTQRLVGTVELRQTDWRLLSTEAAYVTAPWARGEGYAVESLLGVAQWLFEDRGFHRLELRTAAGNTAAQQVAQKIGCISEGVLRSAWIVRTGEVGSAGEESRSDLILWSLLPEDLDEPDSADGFLKDRYAMQD